MLASEILLHKGTYFCQLTVDRWQFTQTEKMTVASVPIPTPTKMERSSLKYKFLLTLDHQRALENVPDANPNGSKNYVARSKNLFIFG